MIIGGLASIVAVLGGIVFSFDRSRLSTIEVKQAQHESLDGHAVGMERMKTIQHQLTRIEAKLDKLQEEVENH